MRPLAGFQLLKDNLWNTYLRSPKGLLFAIVPPAGLAIFFAAPKGLYVWHGMAAWLLFATLVLTISNVLTGNRTIFERYPIQPRSFLLFPLLRAFINYWIACSVLIILLTLAGFPPTPKNAALGLFLILPLGALGFGFGLFMSVTRYLYQWKANILLLGSCLLILWEPQPLSILIHFPGEVLLNGDLTGAQPYGLASAAAFMLFFFGFRFFGVAEKRLFKKCP